MLPGNECPSNLRMAAEEGQRKVRECQVNGKPSVGDQHTRAFLLAGGITSVQRHTNLIAERSEDLHR